MNPSSDRIQVNATVTHQEGAIRCALDSRTWTGDASEQLIVSGWVIHRHENLREVCITSGKQEIARAKVEVFRAWVSEVFAGYPNAPAAGFRFAIPGPGPGKFTVSAVLPDGELQRIADLTLKPAGHPRVLFMHIPKTAGSSLNHWLGSNVSRGACEFHVESQPRWFTDVEHYRNLDLVAGHFSLPHFQKRLDIAQYYCVTVLREPYSQLASHLAWIRKLSDAGEEGRYQNHPEYIRTLSGKLAEMDFASPDQIDAVVRSLDVPQSQLISNCHIRYFVDLGDDGVVEEHHLEKALSASRAFDRIGRTEDTGSLVQHIASDLGWPHPEPMEKRNVSAGLYGLDVSDPDIRAALEPLVRYDLQFFNKVGHGSRSSSDSARD